MYEQDSHMTGQEYLKNKNTPRLWLFIGVNCAAFLSVVIAKRLTGSSIEHFWQHVSAKDGLIALCMPLTTIVLNGLLGDLAKARLVFWRWRFPLPGCRVFTVFLKTDPRVDVPALRVKYGEFPKDPMGQNALWYQIYKKHSEKITVVESHRAYLLTRDIAALSAIFLALFPVGSLIAMVGSKMVNIYGVILATQYLIVSTAARNYGKRFVLNVLAEESHTK